MDAMFPGLVRDLYYLNIGIRRGNNGS